MNTTDIIVGIGEASWATGSGPGEGKPAGLAPMVALRAAQAGFTGVPISRIGQDQAGAALMGALIGAKIGTEHIQTDPDLPTAVLATRRGGASGNRAEWRYASPAAFDVLQWDFDLIDVAQEAAGVVYGQVARRNWQSRSVISQFLRECGGAIRLFDATNREGAGAARADVVTALEHATCLLADAATIGTLVQGAKSEGLEAVEAGARKLVKGHNMECATVLIAGEGVLVVKGEDRGFERVGVPGMESADAVAVAVICGLLEGASAADMASCAGHAWMQLATDRQGGASEQGGRQ